MGGERQDDFDADLPGELHHAGDDHCIKDSTDDEICDCVPEAKAHDPNMLPHEYAEDQLDELFPQAKVQDESHGEIVGYEPGNRELVYGPVVEHQELRGGGVGKVRETSNPQIAATRSVDSARDPAA